MGIICCLAGLDRAIVPKFVAIVADADPVAETRICGLNVTEIGKISPHLLICDVDAVHVDSSELFRQLRFVLPDCTIAAYTGNLDRAWAATCHLAGVSCLLSKASSNGELAGGLRAAIASGCYTDPRFEIAAAS